MPRQINQIRSPTWLIYGLGGGWGHLNRSLALARAAAAEHQQLKLKIISNSHHLSLALSALSRLAIPNCQILAIEPGADFQTTKKRVEQILQREQYDCLIVDTFPRGLGGELKDLLPRMEQPKVLVNRYLKPKYVEDYQLRQYVSSNYDLILIPGERTVSPFADLAQAQQTPPWLICNHDQLANYDSSLNLLGLSQEQTAQQKIIVLASGYVSELADYGKVAATLHQQGYLVRCLSRTLPPHCPKSIWRSHYPALECLWLADLVVGSGGYNTLSECDQLQLPLIALAHQRLYDCQAARIMTQSQKIHPIEASKICLAENQLEAVRLVDQLLPQVQSKALLFDSSNFSPPHFVNGTTAAVTRISQLL